MIERWIEDAEEEGRQEKAILTVLKAQGIANMEMAHFTAEDVSDEALAAYLERFEVPVLRVVGELQRKNYAVKDSTPGMILDSLAWRNRSLNLTDYSRGQSLGAEGDEAHVFGRCWEIVSPNGGFLGDVRIYLKATGDVTHFAGADYLGTSEFFGRAIRQTGALRTLIRHVPHLEAPLELGTEGGDFVAHVLRVNVSNWIKNAQIPDALRNRQ
jgi:hypothetical protein